MWEQLGHGEHFKAGWPSYDESAMKDDEIEVPVQINGKTRAVISISADASKDEAIAAGKEAVADKLTGTIVKEIYVPKKIINIVSEIILRRKSHNRIKVLGNIEKFAENQGFADIFSTKKRYRRIPQNIVIDFLKWSNIGVKSERKWSKYFKGKYIEIGDCNKE